MAVEPERTEYPVWVGSLKEQIKEADLKRVFAKFGTISSCVLKRDDLGNSRYAKALTLHYLLLNISLF